MQDQKIGHASDLAEALAVIQRDGKPRRSPTRRRSFLKPFPTLKTRATFLPLSDFLKKHPILMPRSPDAQRPAETTGLCGGVMR